MKKVLFLLTFVFAAGMVSAQKCNKSASKKCCAKKTQTAAVQTTPETQVASMIAEADAAAALDETIEKKVCETSGKVSYSQKSVCSTSGKVSFQDVMYDSEAKTFVNVSPSATVKASTAEVIPVSESAPAKPAACSKSKKSCAKTCAKKKAMEQ